MVANTICTICTFCVTTFLAAILALVPCPFIFPDNADSAHPNWTYYKVPLQETHRLTVGGGTVIQWRNCLFHSGTSHDTYSSVKGHVTSTHPLWPFCGCLNLDRSLHSWTKRLFHSWLFSYLSGLKPYSASMVINWYMIPRKVILVTRSWLFLPKWSMFVCPNCLYRLAKLLKTP